MRDELALGRSCRVFSRLVKSRFAFAVLIVHCCLCTLVYKRLASLNRQDEMLKLLLSNFKFLFILWAHVCSHVHFPVSATTSDGSIDLEEVIFPPIFVPSSDPTIPPGHLQMFGLQRPPNGPVVEYSTVLKPQEFWETHVSQNRPLVFRQAIADSPARKIWTDEYLKETYGDLDVLTELKTENRTHGMTSRMLFGDFIDVYQKLNLYVVTVLPDPMRQDLPVSSCLCLTIFTFVTSLLLLLPCRLI